MPWNLSAQRNAMRAPCDMPTIAIRSMPSAASSCETLTKTYLEDLARQSGDSAALTVLDGTEIVYVARTSVRTLMRLEAHVGSRFPAYPTSMGRVLLAGLSAERLDKYFDTARFAALTSHTVTDPAKLMKLIEECRRAAACTELSLSA